MTVISQGNQWIVHDGLYDDIFGTVRGIVMGKGLRDKESDDHDDHDGILRTYSGRHTKEKLLPVREHLLVYSLPALISDHLNEAQ
jgi:hypothetical protein